MPPWEQRPFEIANLFNPAFCALILLGAISGYNKHEKSHGLPFALTFIVLPLILHKATRENLPSRIDARFYNWVEDYPIVRYGLADRVRNFVPITRESIMFGMQEKLFKLGTKDKKSSIINGNDFFPVTKRSHSWNDETEPAVCYEKAHFLGRWFAQSGDEVVIFKLLGIQL